jgi:hypothetical protein
MKYVVVTRNGNPQILQLQEDGTYTVIAFASGENNLSEVMGMVQLANRAIINGSTYSGVLPC